MKLWIRIALFPLLSTFMTLLFANSLSGRFTAGEHAIEGYVINIGTATVTKYGNLNDVYTVKPFSQAGMNGQSAAEYLANNRYTTNIPPAKIVFFTTKNAAEPHPDNEGCAFIYTADASSYYIAASPVGSHSKCSVDIPKGDGFDKSNFLIVDVTS